VTYGVVIAFMICDCRLLRFFASLRTRICSCSENDPRPKRTRNNRPVFIIFQPRGSCSTTKARGIRVREDTAVVENRLKSARPRAKHPKYYPNVHRAMIGIHELAGMNEDIRFGFHAFTSPPVIEKTKYDAMPSDSISFGRASCDWKLRHGITGL